MMNERILLVGDKRICPQVAYVMDWQNCAMVERLSAEDVIKYSDHKIVICDFKRKRKRYIPVGGGGGYTYLDNVLREINRCEQADNANLINIPLWRRLQERIKNKEFGLAILRKLKHPFVLQNYKIINRLPVATLKLSELFIKVLYSKPTNIICNRLETNCEINEAGIMWGCCDANVPLAVVNRVEGLKVYNNLQARVVRLSSLNRSYCLCNPRKCQFARFQDKIDDSLKPLQGHDYPATLTLMTDKTCNLRCSSCRRNYLVAGDDANSNTKKIDQALFNAGWLTKVENLMVAASGEVFYSKDYRNLLTSDLQRKQISILSNGTLFNRANWEIIKNKYDQIDVSISVDAATAVTYQKIRGGDFKQLRQNLAMLADLRAKGEIRHFELNFVVQKDNYREMADFVRLAKRLHVDRVHFSHLNNWGTFTNREYKDKCLIVRHRRLHQNLLQVLQDPIFQEPIVDLWAFSRYIKNFTQKFPQNYNP